MEFVCSITHCLKGTLFPPERLDGIYRLMRRTLDLLKGTSGDEHQCTGGRCPAVSAVIVRENGQQVVAEAVSSTRQHPMHHAVVRAVTEVADLHRKAKSAEADQHLPRELCQLYRDDYLCTDYECYLSQEPCLMCAMALVHSRIKRVFFYHHPGRTECDECSDGAYTAHKLHLNCSLNHRYEAWKISPLPTEQETYPNKKLRPD